MDDDDEMPNPLGYDEIMASWGGWQNFMRGYGLKPWDLDDMGEAQQEEVLKLLRGSWRWPGWGLGWLEAL